MNHRAGDDRLIHVKIMNEYFADIPLWENHESTDGEGLDISEALLEDLKAFAARWAAAVPAEISDDRWDGVPVMSSLVRARYSLGRLLHPARERAAEVEDAAMRELGEDLRARLELELGPRYRVTYLH